jgi:hypothetical protein
LIKPYTKPIVTQVELRPVEASLLFCKTHENISDAPGEGIAGCRGVQGGVVTCLTSYGS